MLVTLRSRGEQTRIDRVAEREDGTAVGFTAWQDNEIRAVSLRPPCARVSAGYYSRWRSFGTVDFYAAHSRLEGPRSSRVSCRAPARVRVDDEAVVVSFDRGHPR